MSTLSERQQSLLSGIITAYIKEAKPISSGMVVDWPGLDVSPATIRNDMADLTEAGYLTQPHTSAGRIPTERAWKWFVENLLRDQDVHRRERDHVSDVIRAYRHSQQELMRHLAKTMAGLVQETVIVAFDRHDTYYTGLSNLFSQPEFEETNMIQQMSRVIDHLDEVMQRMFDQVEEEIQVFVGHDSPFGADCGAVVARYAIPSQTPGLIGILGPTRQNYAGHVALVKCAQEQLKSLA